jgi:hypothetical protein
VVNCLIHEQEKITAAIWLVRRDRYFKKYLSTFSSSSTCSHALVPQRVVGNLVDQLIRVFTTTIDELDSSSQAMHTSLRGWRFITTEFTTTGPFDVVLRRKEIARIQVPCHCVQVQSHRRLPHHRSTSLLSTLSISSSSLPISYHHRCLHRPRHQQFRGV